jgi:hypothetical protein
MLTLRGQSRVIGSIPRSGWWRTLNEIQDGGENRSAEAKTSPGTNKRRVLIALLVAVVVVVASAGYLLYSSRDNLPEVELEVVVESAHFNISCSAKSGTVYWNDVIVHIERDDLNHDSLDFFVGPSYWTDVIGSDGRVWEYANSYLLLRIVDGNGNGVVDDGDYMTVCHESLYLLDGEYDLTLVWQEWDIVGQIQWYHV